MLEKILGQETSVPPPPSSQNETGPIRLCVYPACVQVSNKYLFNPPIYSLMQATLSLNMQMFCACLLILNIFLELCYQFYVIGRFIKQSEAPI